MSEARNPFDTWRRVVVNPDAQLVIKHEHHELVDHLRTLADLVESLPARPQVEDHSTLETLRYAYRFFDNGTWNTPELEAWCITSPPPFKGWDRSVRAAFRTREDAEAFLPEMVAYYAARYPSSANEELLIERAMARVVDLKERPGESGS